MTCREFADFMADYLAGELPDSSRERFERHLGLCANCRKYLTSYQESLTLGRQAFEDENGAVPGDVPEELVRGILEARRPA